MMNHFYVWVIGGQRVLMRTDSSYHFWYGFSRVVKVLAL